MDSGCWISNQVEQVDFGRGQKIDNCCQTGEEEKAGVSEDERMIVIRKGEREERQCRGKKSEDIQFHAELFECSRTID